MKNLTTLASAETRIASLITPELEAKALRELEGCLEAEVYVRSGRGADGIDYRSVPDRAIRLAAAVQVIQFSRGKPATSLTLTSVPGGNQQTPTPKDLAKLIAENPEIAMRVIDSIVANARTVLPVIGRSGEKSD